MRTAADFPIAYRHVGLQLSCDEWFAAARFRWLRPDWRQAALIPEAHPEPLERRSQPPLRPMPVQCSAIRPATMPRASSMKPV